MRIKTVKLYQYDELSKKAKENALKHWQENNNECFWENEIHDSFKALFKHTNGLKLKDWEIGAYSYSSCRVEFNEDAAGELTGKRAQAWLENNLLSSLRVPFTGHERKDLAQYGSYYRPGMIKPCPFTGYCADDDFIDALRKAVNKGETLKDSFEGLAYECKRILEREYEYQGTEEYFMDHAMANNYEFDREGNRV